MNTFPFFKIRAYLKRGGVIAYPTESSYGLGCLANNRRGIRGILRIKKRPQHKGLIVIGRDFGQLQPYVFRLPEYEQNQIERAWHDDVPTTFLLRCRANVLPELRGRRRNQLAVRVPQHDLARRLCGAVGGALVSTSCNRAGKRACRSEREVRRQFGRAVWVIGGRTGGRKSPSQIVNWETKERVR